MKMKMIECPQFRVNICLEKESCDNCFVKIVRNELTALKAERDRYKLALEDIMTDTGKKAIYMGDYITVRQIALVALEVKDEL